MGVNCSFGVLNLDAYTECANVSHQFYAGKDELGFRYQFLMCSESATFELGSSSITQIIPNVTIRTDDQWIQVPNIACIMVTTAGQNPTISTSPVPAPIPPTQSPITSVPSSSPIVETAFPSVKLSIKPSTPPTLASIQPRESPPFTSTSQNTSSIDGGGGDNSGIIIGTSVGSIVAGFAVTAVIGYFLFLRKRDATTGSNNINPKPNLSVADTSPTDSNVNDDFSPTSQISSGTNIISTASVVQQSEVVPPSTRRVSSSTEYVVDVKDQCRSVARDIPPPSTHGNILTPNYTDTGHIPMAVAYGVSSTSTESNRSKEPPGRVILDF
jgi:hypothetical protein